ncbi:MAG: beta-eliminating lyase-related protein [Gammaproteobacteria bacterium]|nr:beta-eliminating lyase-related protein [Gammaproteobacteria bacterium]
MSEILKNCTDILPGHGSRLNVKEMLSSLAEVVDESVAPDVYGAGEYISEFEAEVAGMFNKASAVFMPSGTMAQQIALRIWCDRAANLTVAMHPESHPEIAEYLGYQYLHGLRRIQFGAPEAMRHRVMNLTDLERLGSKPAAVLIELPMRMIGGQLPDWDELVAMSRWCREREIAIHLDGARIWQCQDYYGRSLGEIGELFDSIYVSFYKDIGGMCGSMLLGNESFIQESRTWQRRHGGNLYTQAPFVVSARTRMHEVLPQIPAWNVRARELAGIFSAHDRVIVNPDPPQVNFFQLYLKGDAVTLMERHQQLAEEQGIFLFNALNPSAVPGYACTEIHAWENAARFDITRLETFLDMLLG